MDRTNFVINALDDLERKSIEYENRFWLRKNVNKLQISISIESGLIDAYWISRWLNEGEVEFFVQNGIKILPKDKGQLNFDEEFLVLVSSVFENVKMLAFLYRPKK